MLRYAFFLSSLMLSGFSSSNAFVIPSVSWSLRSPKFANLGILAMSCFSLSGRFGFISNWLMDPFFALRRLQHPFTEIHLRFTFERFQERW